MSSHATAPSSEISFVKRSRPQADPFELVYLSSSDFNPLALLERCLCKDCNQMGLNLPKAHLSKVLVEGTTLQFREHESSYMFFDLQEQAAVSDTELLGVVVGLELKKLPCDATPYLKVRFTPVSDKPPVSLSEKPCAFSLLQWLRLYVHDYNNLNHISGGYLKYALDEAPANSDLAEDIQGAIDVLQRNLELTEELSEFTHQRLSSNQSYTQVHSLICRLLESQDHASYINNLERATNDHSLFLIGDHDAIESALLTLLAELEAETLTIASSIESVAEDYNSDKYELLAGDYLALDLNTHSRDGNSKLGSKTELKWAKKVISSIGGDVVSQNGSLLRIFLPLSDPHRESTCTRT